MDVLEDDGRQVMTAGAHRDDPTRRTLHERRREQAGQQKMTDVVRAELELESVGGFREGRGHHTRVVDEDVKRAVSRDVCAAGSEDASRLLADSARSTGDDRKLAGEIDAFRDLGGRRFRSELRCVSHGTHKARVGGAEP